MKFVNLFSNEFYFYKAFRDGNGQDDIVHDDLTGQHKLCLVKCKPGTTYTIAHSSAISQRLVIGSLTSNKRNLSVSKILNVLDTTLAPGNATLYTTSSESDGERSRDAQYIIIQCSSNIEDYSQLEEIKVLLELGDVNQDGRIDNVDRKILADYLFYPQEDLRRPVLTKRQLAACDINNDGKIDQTDLEWLAEFLNGDRPSLGTIEYKYYVPRKVNELNDVASLLVMEGNMIERPTGETKKCETGIFHPKEVELLFSEDNTYEDLSNIEINIDYEVEDEEQYDRVEYGFNILKIEGNSKIDYFDETQRISPYKPATVTSISDLIINVNNKPPINRDLSDTKLSKIGQAYDSIFQQQDKYYYSKAITEIFSQELSWVRRTTINGISYLRSSITGLKPTLASDVGNIFASKFEVVSANDILNEVFTHQYEVAVDEQGRIMLYSSEINNFPVELDMLAWLSNNKFYIYGELETYETKELSLEVGTIELDKGLNTVKITSKSLLPEKMYLQTTIKGIKDSYIEKTNSTFQVMQSPIGLNFSQFTDDPWIVNHKIIPYILGYAITPYSRSEEITYVQNMLSEIYPIYKDSFIPGIYSEYLRQLIEDFQRTYIHYNKGDLNLDNRVNLTDIKLVEDYLNGLTDLSENQLKIADTNSDQNVDINDVNNMYKEYMGINDYLKYFDIQFLMGYVDPSTEYRMQKMISTKIRNDVQTEIGWTSSRPH